MHSIKNTVIAMGLLGLSFVFYHFSAGPIEEPDAGSDTSMASLADHSAEQPPTLEMRLPKLNSPSSEATSKPDLSPAEDLKLDIGLKNRKPDAEASIPSIELSRTPTAKRPDEFQAPKLTPQLPPQPNPRKAPLDGVTLNNTPQLNLNPVDPIQRDQGLIQALEVQRSTGTQTTSADKSFEQKASANVDNGNTFEPNNNAFAADSAASMEPFAPAERAATPGQADLAPISTGDQFRNVWPEVDRLVQQNQLKASLKKLTSFYGRPDLTGPQRQRLLAWLDGLAGKVIFSTEHRLTSSPYVCNGQETLRDIAAKWKVPANLIANVNRKALASATANSKLPQGMMLKQISGPFQASISLSEKTLTLFVQGMYAGRFPVRVGIAGEPRPGRFQVILKSQEGAQWVDADGNSYPPSSPNNGYGPFFLGLTGKICIHAVGDDKTDGHYGCIGLTKKDAQDLFDILSDGSVVTVSE